MINQIKIFGQWSMYTFLKNLGTVLNVFTYVKWVKFESRIGPKLWKHPFIMLIYNLSFSKYDITERPTEKIKRGSKHIITTTYFKELYFERFFSILLLFFYEQKLKIHRRFELDLNFWKRTNLVPLILIVISVQISWQWI